MLSLYVTNLNQNFAYALDWGLINNFNFYLSCKAIHEIPQISTKILGYIRLWSRVYTHTAIIQLFNVTYGYRNASSEVKLARFLAFGVAKGSLEVLGHYKALDMMSCYTQVIVSRYIIVEIAIASRYVVVEIAPSCMFNQFDELIQGGKVKAMG